MWRDTYEDPNFIDNIESLWNKVKPLYSELQKFMKRKLAKMYSGKVKESEELIPAHLFGNMWAQSWINLYDATKPYEKGALIDTSEAMQKQNYTALKMFKMSDQFFKDLGLEPNDMSYGPNAIIEKPDREIACHASAWDFADGEDFRIKMCTKVKLSILLSIKFCFKLKIN